MSKSLGQTLGGVVGAVGGFFLGGGIVGAARGFVIGSSLCGMIDPPPGPDLKGPTLEDRSFNSAAYGVSLATLHGTIAHTGSIIYLENNEYKAIAKKTKTGGKGGGSKGSYTTTTYFSTFAVAIAEAMPGSAIRRIWAGGKLIYSLGIESGDESIEQSNLNADSWVYYDGTQTEPDSRMEATLGVGNCPSYEGTAYIIFYDFDLTDYGNGLQGCPIKVEVSESGKGYEFYEGFETITLDSTVHAGHASDYANGISVSTTDPSDVLEIILSGTDNAWRISSVDGWRSRISIVIDDDPGSLVNFGSSTEYSTKAEAQSHFPVGATITGGTKYTFFMNDFPYNNNSGTMSFSVPIITPVEVVKKRPKLLSDIAETYLKKAGIAESFYDLAALDNEVFGYKVTDVSSARGALGPLQVAYLFDWIEDGYTLKAVKRGGSSIATIPLSKCGARGAGESPGVRVQRDRETESQLPSRYSLTYIDYNREYDTNTQYADYPSRAVCERNQQLPIVLSANEAAQLVDILTNLAWAERFSYEFSWPQEYSYLKASNVVTAEVAAGVWAVVRISNITYTADQRVQVSARRAEPTVYQSSAVGIDVAPPSENIPLITDANTVIMDLPAITDDVTGYGFGVAMYGGESWPGGNLLRSIDTGQTYDAIQAFTGNCTVATATNSLAAGDYFVIDRASELNITVVAGDFFSITEDQMLTGKHYCAYGVDGRWEIIQYAVSSVVSGPALKLSTFVRGLFGTEWAGDLHEAGDWVVLLDDPDTAFIGADAVALNSPRKFKGITNGQDAQLIDEIDFTYRGTNLKPLSAVNVTGALVSEVWTISCTKRTRMASNQWSTGVSAPIGETALLFEFEFYEGAVFKKMYQSATEIFVYSPVNQLADFGYLPTTLKVKIYQISAVIGRGFVAEKTLLGLADPYGDKVVLLLHFNDVNNSTVITDSSKSPKTISVNGNAKITTAQSRFGGSCLALDGVGDFLSILAHADFGFGTGDYTIELWLLTSSTGLALLDNRTTTHPATFYVAPTTGRIGYYASSNLEGTSNIANGVWRHLAWSRVGGVLKQFVDGLQEYSAANTNDLGSSRPLRIGIDYLNNNATNGYIDELRITKGVGRYTGDFPKPVAPFSDPA